VNVRWWSGTITSRFSTRLSCYAHISIMARRMHIGVFYRCWCARCVHRFSASTLREDNVRGYFAQDGKAECGILSVPENRSSEKSRMIHLPVVVLHSRAPGAPHDAVLFMTGGPGLSSTSNVPTSRDVIFTEDRDYVVLEQRGAPNADPALACPEMVAPKSEIAAGRLKGAPAAKALAAAARWCRNRLVSEGADLAGYTSAETAVDIEDLRKGLGYQQWDLYGISYSTRLMLTVARVSGSRSEHGARFCVAARGQLRGSERGEYDPGAECRL
jgi:hypothetical protein